MENLNQPKKTTDNENTKTASEDVKKSRALKEDERLAKIAENQAYGAERIVNYQESRVKRVKVDIRACHHRINVEAETINALTQKSTTILKLVGALLKAEAALAEITSKVKEKDAIAKTIGKAEAKELDIKRRQARAEAKKAQLELEEANNAKELLKKHTQNMAKAKAVLKLREIELENRQALITARTLQAEAKRSEASALRRGNRKMAEEKREAARYQRAIALEKELAIRDNNAKEHPRRASEKREHRLQNFTQRKARLVEKKHLSAKGLLDLVHKVFQEIPEINPKANNVEERTPRKKTISLCDCLMSGLAVFGLKYPSLLQFDRDSQEGGCIQHNLKTFFNVLSAPSDTYMREMLDEVDPAFIRPAFKKIFAQFQRGKDLEKYEFLDGWYLVAGDGSGFFSSKTIRCGDCCEKNHRDGSSSYYHQMMSAAIVHPDHPTVIPFCPEPITSRDGSEKNDCERNASERLYRHIRREHPHLRLIITEDALGANGPHIRLLEELDMRFIIVVKPDSNRFIFEFLKGVKLNEVESKDKEGRVCKIQFVNDIPLNDANRDLKVNFLEAWIYDKNGDLEYHNTWITNIAINKNNAHRLCQGGRTKWKVENETFNTLKNQGYHFEHNFGHGLKHLSTVFAFLMYLAFTIDQIQQFSCGIFKAALETMETKARLWVRMRSYFMTLYIDSWEDLWMGIAFGIEGGRLKPLKASVNTS